MARVVPGTVSLAPVAGATPGDRDADLALSRRASSLSANAAERPAGARGGGRNGGHLGSLGSELVGR